MIKIFMAISLAFVGGLAEDGDNLKDRVHFVVRYNSTSSQLVNASIEANVFEQIYQKMNSDMYSKCEIKYDFRVHPERGTACHAAATKSLPPYMYSCRNDPNLSILICTGVQDNSHPCRKSVRSQMFMIPAVRTPSCVSIEWESEEEGIQNFPSNIIQCACQGENIVTITTPPVTSATRTLATTTAETLLDANVTYDLNGTQFMERTSETNGFNSSIILYAGLAGGVFIVVVAIIIAVVMVRKRRQAKTQGRQYDGCRAFQNPDYAVDKACVRYSSPPHCQLSKKDSAFYSCTAEYLTPADCELNVYSTIHDLEQQ